MIVLVLYTRFRDKSGGEAENEAIAGLKVQAAWGGREGVREEGVVSK